jgi:hypothetical protein
MFYFLKNLLLLILIIFKLKRNDLIANEIMILNVSYVCLQAFSIRRKSPDPDPEKRTLISDVILSYLLPLGNQEIILKIVGLA